MKKIWIQAKFKAASSRSVETTSIVFHHVMRRDAWLLHADTHQPVLPTRLERSRRRMIPDDVPCRSPEDFNRSRNGGGGVIAVSKTRKQRFTSESDTICMSCAEKMDLWSTTQGRRSCSLRGWEGRVEVGEGRRPSRGQAEAEQRPRTVRERGRAAINQFGYSLTFWTMPDAARWRLSRREHLFGRDLVDLAAT